MEEKKKNSVGKFVLIIILLILFLIGGFFGGKYYAESKKVDSKEVKEEKEVDKEEELDINSRLVQYLYNLVTYDVKSCSGIWEYSEKPRYHKELLDVKDFYVKDADETIKMNLVGRLVSKEFEKWIPIEEMENKEGYLKNRYEEASGNYYSKEYIESLYKLLFGDNEKLDTSKNIVLDLYGAETLIFNQKNNRYCKYFRSTGGTCGPVGEETKLSTAIKKGNTIKIYQQVNYFENDNNVIEKYKYVYTFELEDDGMYKFVSRVKEK